MYCDSKNLQRTLPERYLGVFSLQNSENLQVTFI